MPPGLLSIKSATSQIPPTAKTSPLKNFLFNFGPSPSDSGYYGNESMYDSDSESIYQNKSHARQTFDMKDKSIHKKCNSSSIIAQNHDKNINLQESEYNSYLMSSHVNLPYLETSPKRFTTDHCFNSKNEKLNVKENNHLFDLYPSEIFDREYSVEPYEDVYNKYGRNMQFKSPFPLECNKNKELSYLEDSIHEPLFSPGHSQNVNTCRLSTDLGKDIYSIIFIYLNK